MNWKSVFDCYPDADKIFVVNDMPFLKMGEAETHAKFVQGKVEVVTRASQYQSPMQEAADKAKAEQEAADKAKAEQEAADKAKAEQEAADKAKAEQEAADKAKADQEAANKAAEYQEEKPAKKGGKKK